MAIHIHNSLSRKKEIFEPLKDQRVNIYTCGVTVYDECHIGHARSLYIFDLIRKYLKYRKFEVHFVRNITDIDDKIISRAKELKIDWKELVRINIDKYYEDLQVLGIERADFEPRATENIPEMIKYVSELVKKEFAYPTKSGVYFNVRKFQGYGKLSGQSIKQMYSGVRKESDESKEDTLDFALWKTSKPDEPSWESPWGKGRPGWHIECSVMSQKFLKVKTLDIHAGGRDLIFPHHENEIAQAEALTGKPFAKYWIHHGLLTINGLKMSKSLGNFVTIKGFLEKYQNPNFLKIFFLSAHYAHPIDFSEQKIEEARQAFERIVILNEKIEDRLTGHKSHLRERKTELIEGVKAKFLQAMDDDFNTPQGLAAIFELVNLGNKHIDDLLFIYNLKITIEELLNNFGISLHLQKKISGISDYQILTKIKQREEARKNKDFLLSDKIRKELETMGVILEDGKDKTTWRRKL